MNKKLKRMFCIMCAAALLGTLPVFSEEEAPVVIADDPEPEVVTPREEPVREEKKVEPKQEELREEPNKEEPKQEVQPEEKVPEEKVPEEKVPEEQETPVEEEIPQEQPAGGEEKEEDKAEEERPQSPEKPSESTPEEPADEQVKEEQAEEPVDQVEELEEPVAEEETPAVSDFSVVLRFEEEKATYDAGSTVRVFADVYGTVIGTLNYRWEIFYRNGLDWEEIPNEKADRIDIEMFDLYDGAQLRAIVTDSTDEDDNEVCSPGVWLRLTPEETEAAEEATDEETEEETAETEEEAAEEDVLVEEDEPVEEGVSVQLPADATFTVFVELEKPNDIIFDGDELTFVSRLEGTVNEPEYQWQANINGEWVDIPGATESTYSITASSENSGMTYRLAVTDAAPESAVEQAEAAQAAPEASSDADETEEPAGEA